MKSLPSSESYKETATALFKAPAILGPEFSLEPRGMLLSVCLSMELKTFKIKPFLFNNLSH